MLLRSARLLGRTAHHDTCIREMQQAGGSLNVVHDSAMMQFYLKIGEDKAIIDYSPIDEHTIDLHYTTVPDVFQGKGVGKALAKGALDYCVKNDLKMKLTCHYLLKFYNDNESSYKSHVVEQ